MTKTESDFVKLKERAGWDNREMGKRGGNTLLFFGFNMCLQSSRRAEVCGLTGKWGAESGGGGHGCGAHVENKHIRVKKQRKYLRRATEKIRSPRACNSRMGRGRNLKSKLQREYAESSQALVGGVREKEVSLSAATRACRNAGGSGGSGKKGLIANEHQTNLGISPPRKSHRNTPHKVS